MKFIFNIIIIIILTVLTQIGGVIFLIVILIFRKKKRKHQFLVFTILYLLATFLIVPNVAPFFGREKIKDSNTIQAHSFIYKLTNRNYVTSKMHHVLKEVSKDLNGKYSGIKLVYLDANFPFINGFPLLPHRSHNDGKKIDLSFIYTTKDGKITNKKPSFLGYGFYENPTKKEHNQINICKNKGYWQYDFAKYLTFGNSDKSITFSEKITKNLILFILKQQAVGKIFIEPHLKIRLGLSKESKVRYHGCQAVRHDDHIHLQLK